MPTLDKPVEGVLSLIGNTPMLKITKLDTGPCELFLKLECQNPGGSIKDRIGLSMIAAAEAEGKIKPGGTLIEATAGNTGLGLALVAAQKGYKLKLVIPDKMSQYKIMHLKAMGAEVILTRSDVAKGHPEYYQDLAETIAAETPNSFYINQFGNPANPYAHKTTTGPEIWEQMDHNIDALVAGVGSGGTVGGLAPYFEKTSPKTEIILADPVGSILADAVNTGTPANEAGSWLVEGIGEDFIPDIVDIYKCNKAFSISDKEAMDAIRDLLLKEGILAGSSTGTLLAAALKYCREQTEPKRVVSFVCDTGNKYLNKAYNDFWMIDQGFIEQEKHGDLRDLISRNFTDSAVVTSKPSDLLSVAYGKMKLFDISQLPIMDEDGKLVGLLDETDMLIALHMDPKAMTTKVESAMSHGLVTVSPKAKIEDLLPILNRGMVAIIADDDEFYGLVTRIDVVNYLKSAVREH